MEKRMKPFFLDEIENAEFLSSLSSNERDELELYLQDMKSPPRSSDEDINWQTDGRSYYRMLHVLADLCSREEKQAFVTRLREDISKWRTRAKDFYVIESVEHALKRV